MPRKRRDHQESINIAEYLAQVKQLGRDHRIQQRESVPTEEAYGRILAEAVTALADVPSFANSAMDGYAVQGADLATIPVTLTVTGQQPAGIDKELSVAPGQAVSIMTGAPVPAGADTVVQSELTEEEDGRVTITGTVKFGANIRQAGEDARRGEEILPVGTWMGGRQLAAAAAVGADKVEAFRQLRIGIVSTGDELARAGAELRPGQIYESNSLMLAGLVQQFGGRVSVRQAITDEPEKLVHVLSELADECDALLLTGGASVGRFDVVRNLLEETEEAHFQRVALQPGKPQGYAIWEGKPVLAFPGNPVGAFVSYHVFGRPFLRELTGKAAHPNPRRQVESAASWRAPEGRTQYIPGILRRSFAGNVVFEPLSKYGSGSHLVSTLGRATALAVIPADVDRVVEGTIIDVEDI